MATATKAKKKKGKESPAEAPRIINAKPELVPASNLKAHPKNPRRGDIEAIRASIRAHGFWGYLIVQQSTSFILAGNHKWEAAQEEGIHEVPVIWVDVDDNLALRILLADNKIAERSEWDFETLAPILREWHEANEDISALGWEDWEIEPLLAASWVPDEEDEDNDILPKDRPSANPDEASIVLSKEQYKLLSEVRRKMVKASDDDVEWEDADVVQTLCEYWLDNNG